MMPDRYDYTRDLQPLRQDLWPGNEQACEAVAQIRAFCEHHKLEILNGGPGMVQVHFGTMIVLLSVCDARSVIGIAQGHGMRLSEVLGAPFVIRMEVAASRDGKPVAKSDLGNTETHVIYLVFKVTDDVVALFRSVMADLLRSKVRRLAVPQVLIDEPRSFPTLDS